MSLLGLALVAITVLQETVFVHAANDWSKPCFSGACSYDIPDSTNGPSGTLKIWGASHAIADITTAGGWEIVSCHPSSLAQDLTIVCQSSHASGPCAHLFSGPSSGTTSSAVKRSVASPTTSTGDAKGSAMPSNGKAAINKIVRLPENCGGSAFARISNAWVPANQTIPPSVAKRLVRRDGEAPVVMAFSVDVDFNSSDARHGSIGFAVVGANVPGAAAVGDKATADLNSNSTPTRRDLSDVQERQLPGWISGVLGTIGSLNTWGIGQSVTLPAFDFDESFTLINQEITCNVAFPVGGLDPTVGVSGKIKIDIDADVDASVSFGVAAKGTIIPPWVDSFGLTSGFTLDITNSTFTVNAGVGGSIGTGEAKLASAGAPPMTFPGIMTIGPTVELIAEATAELDLDLNLVIGVDYHLDNAQFTFPGGPVSGSFTPLDTPISLSFQPSGSASPKIDGHLKPTIVFSIEALGIITAAVMANIDASATASLTVGATFPQQNVTVTPRSEAVETAKPVKERSAVVARQDLPDPFAGVTFGGCAEVELGLSVNVGASGNFFNIFDPSITLPLFSGMFPLFDQCFGDPPPGAKSRRSDSGALIKVVEKRQSDGNSTISLKCNDPDILGQPIVMANSVVVPASQLLGSS